MEPDLSQERGAASGPLGLDPAARPAAAPTHWARLGERGNVFGIKAMLFAARYLGRWFFSLLLYPVMAYFFLFARAARRASREYLTRLAAAAPAVELRPTGWTSYRHFLSMGQIMLDKAMAYAGAIRLEHCVLHDHEVMNDLVLQGVGGVVLTAHLGNLEAIQAISDENSKLKLNVLVHTRNAANFNRILQQVKPDLRVRLVEVADFGPDTMMDLTARVGRGEWVVLSADRVPVKSDRTVEVDFLGGRAPLPVGPFVLAGLLSCPVMFLACLKLDDGRYHFFYERFAEKLSWTRATRNEVVQRSAQRYADRVAHFCTLAPLQWFNFFPFWKST